MQSQLELVSKFWLNDNRYITDSDWIIVTNKVCKGIRYLLVSLCFILFILPNSLLTPCSQYYILFSGVERSS